MRETLTNEEKRVIYYAEESQPTISSSVNPETPLSSLNLNWLEKELPERQRIKHIYSPISLFRELTRMIRLT